MYQKDKDYKVTVRLTETQYRGLKNNSEGSILTVSEQIRKAIDNHIEGNERDEQKRVSTQ